MDLITEMEVAANLVTPKLTVVLANREEANFGIDKLKNHEFPVLFVLPMIVRDARGTSGVWKSVVPMLGFVLFKDPDQRTLEYSTNDVEKRFVIPARTLGRQFFMHLSKSDIVDKETPGIINPEWTPAYSEFDSTLYGVSFSVDIPIIEGTTCNR